MKKIALACALLLSNSAFSAITTTVYVPPITRASPNQDYAIYTNHSYVAANDTGVAQSVAVCFTTALCYDVAPQYKKILQSCDRFVLQPGQVKTDSKSTKLPFNYPAIGFCNVDATTEAFGWVHSLSSGKGRLRVWPN